jgi:hypothetical protein
LHYPGLVGRGSVLVQLKLYLATLDRNLKSHDGLVQGIPPVRRDMEFPPILSFHLFTEFSQCKNRFLLPE